MKPAMERQSIREATSEEAAADATAAADAAYAAADAAYAAAKEYILKLDSFAENIETDGVSIFWSEEGTSAQFSTQMPSTTPRQKGRHKNENRNHSRHSRKLY